MPASLTPKIGFSYNYGLGENGWKTGYDENWIRTDSLIISTYGYNRATSVALTYGYLGGYAYVSGVLTLVANGTIALANNTTNYVERDSVTGVVSANAVGFTTSKIPMAVVVTLGGSITSVVDARAPDTGLVTYPTLAGEVGVTNNLYPAGNIRRYGAVGNNVANDQVAVQAAMTFCCDDNSHQGRVPKMHIPFGNFKVTGLVIPSNISRLQITGDGKYNAILHYEGSPNACISIAGGVYANLNFADFSIYGDVTSGRGIDMSNTSDFVYNCTFERMQIFAGAEAMFIPRLFSSMIHTVYAESVNKHIFQVHCGPGVSWINCYAGRCPAGKGGYRLSGNIYMFACNGVNLGDYWGIFGNNPTGTDGFQNDFPGIGISYPDIVLIGCNLEAWNVTALYVTQAYQQLYMKGGSIVRTLVANYHSVIHTVLQPLPAAGGYIELDSVRALITGGVATTHDIQNETIGPLLLKNDSTGFLGTYSVSAGFLYPPLKEGTVANTFGEYAKSISSLSVRRFSVDMMRFNDNTLAIGATAPNVTGMMLVRTANTAPTNLGILTVTQTAGAGGDSARNGFIFVQVEDSFTTFKHQIGSGYQLTMLGGKDYLAVKGEVLIFALTEYDTGVLHRGWVQISASRFTEQLVGGTSSFKIRNNANTNDNLVVADAGDVTISRGNGIIATLGKGLQVKEGVNGKQGSAVLVAGTVVVANTSVTVNSKILLTSQVDGGTPGFVRISARTPGTSFTILSSNIADTSTIGWEIFEPAP